jgi:hypothetical protein
VNEQIDVASSDGEVAAAVAVLTAAGVYPMDVQMLFGVF